MTDDDRKILTKEVLGECWHERSSILGKCIHCGRVCNRVTSMDNRPFTTPDDVFAVKNMIAKMGKWRVFFRWAYETYHKEFGTMPHIYKDDIADYTSWLFRTVNEKGEPHFCQLCCDFFKEH